MTRRNVREEGRGKWRRSGKTDRSRRRLLGAIAAGGGAVVAGTTLPRNWTKPVVDAVVLPLHAQASGAGRGTAFATDGVGGTLSNLYTVNVATGVTRLIGSIGYAVNSIAFYRGTLYGTQRLGGAWLRINTATGAGTAIGSLGGDYVTSLAISSAGEVFGWSESGDGLRRVNIATGATTPLGSSLSSASHGLAFLGSTLYFHNYDGNVYTIDTATGARTLVGNTGLGREAIDGDVNPLNGRYYGVNWQDGGSSPALNMVNLATATSAGSVATDIQLHTIAFVS